MTYLIVTILALILIIVILTLVIKNVSSENKKIKDINKNLISDLEKVLSAEKKKTKVREKYEGIEVDINNGDDDNVIELSNYSTKRYNHPFGESCGKDCPAYSRDK